MDDEVVAPDHGGARPARLVARFQAALLALSVLSSAFVAVELASLRHWKSSEQIVPWIVLGVLVCSALIVVFNRSRIAIVQARIIALCAAPAALFGVYEHVSANLDTRVLNHKYAWAELPAWEHLCWHRPALSVVPRQPRRWCLRWRGVLLGLATIGMAPDTARDDFAQDTGVDVARVRT